MTNWTTHDSNEPPALAPAALVEVECEYPAWRYRVDEVCWEPGLRCRQFLDPDGTPYISAEGLKERAEYVATDENGEVWQYSSEPQREDEVWGNPYGLIEEPAPETHRHPGDWRESLCRVWRD